MDEQRKKLIAELEESGAEDCFDDEVICVRAGTVKAAIALLKVQETRFIDKGEDIIQTGDIVRRWQCESCGDYIRARFDLKPKFKYCSNCGKAVKWDEPPKEG